MKCRLVVAALFLSACGDDAPSAPTTTAVTQVSLPSASISLAVDTKRVKNTGNSKTPLRAEWTIVVQETGGVAGRLAFVNSTLRDATSGARALPKATAALAQEALLLLLGSDRLAAGGSVSVPGSLEYALPSGGKVGILSVAVQVEDDNGHVLSALTEVEVR